MKIYKFVANLKHGNKGQTQNLCAKKIVIVATYKISFISHSDDTLCTEKVKAESRMFVSWFQDVFCSPRGLFPPRDAVSFGVLAYCLCTFSS